MNRDDVIDVLTAVAAADRRTVGKADVEIWEEIIGSLPKDLALQAVRNFLRDRPGVWLEPGHVVEGARAIKRDWLEREPDSAREARQELLAAKVQEDVAELAGRKGIPEQVREFRAAAAYLSVRCPWCRAGVGQHCAVPQTNRRPYGGVHPSRRDAALDAQKKADA